MIRWLRYLGCQSVVSSPDTPELYSCRGSEQGAPPLRPPVPMKGLNREFDRYCDLVMVEMEDQMDVAELRR